MKSSSNLKRRAAWLLVLACLLVAGVAAAMLKRQAPPAATKAAAAPAPYVLEFLPADIGRVERGDLRRLLPVTGSLRALDQATVKAKVAGDVREVLVREGEAVKAGQVLVRMDASDYQARLVQARGALDAARGQLDIATKARDSNKALLAKGFISKNAYDNAASQYDIARANVESARGALDVAQKAVADTVIRAPISGLVSGRSVQPGEKVAIDSRLLDLVDLSRMEMAAAVPASEVVNVAVGQQMPVTIEGMQHALSGKVVRINPATEAGSRSILVYIRLDNPDNILRVGMFGEAKLTVARKSGVLAIPRSALHSDMGSSYVYAIENGKVVRRRVVTGMQGDDGHGDAVEIVDGLDAGMQIVQANLGELRPGASARISEQRSAAPAPASGQE